MGIKIFKKLTWCFFCILIFFSNCGNKENLPIQPSYQEMEDAAWGNYPGLGEGTVTYEVSPVDLKYIREISPLGHISACGHPIPTSHIYWELARTDLEPFPPEDGFNKPVRAPARGVVTKIIFTSWAGYADYSVHISHTNTFRTVFNHLSEIDSEILSKTGTLQVGENKIYVPVDAGHIIGRTSAAYAQSAALDMGTYDRTVHHFIHPEKYPVLIPNAVSPFDYFRDDLKALVYEKVKRRTEPRGGKFDFDERGKLVGNWFLEGTTGSTDDGWKNYLSFAYDMYDPQYLRISLGEKAGCMLARVKGNAPDFKDIDVTSGEVVYKLIPVEEGAEFLSYCPLSDYVIATLLVKMINIEKIKIEVFDGDISNPSFTSNAKYYTR